ncbi:MAG: hypothetical protein WCK65_03990 [Rhodospirillaceae bacterium]
MIAKMLFHTVSAVVIIAGLAGVVQNLVVPDGAPTFTQLREKIGGHHDD